MTEMIDRGPIPRTGGKVFRWAWGYDLLLRIIWRRGERVYRERVLDLARLAPGDAVLDVGCGTGTLAIAAKRRVGQAGKVAGIDASAEMIARARRKARKARVQTDFELAVAEALPFPDATFDTVLSTTVLHCLPDDARAEAIREMRRVLKPGGRLLIVDFGGPREERRSLVAHLSHHRQFDIRKMTPLLHEAGLTGIEPGAVGFSDLQFIRAAAPRSAQS